MPQVPYNPVPDVSPSGQGSPYLSDRGATPEAFGYGVGAAQERLGSTIERAASTLENNVLSAQRLKNEADVNAATTADILTSGELNNKFRQLPGSQAQEALEGHVKSLTEAREKLRASLTNPEAQRLFDQQTMHRLALDVVNSSQHAATQMRQYTKQTYVDKEDTIVQDTARRVRNGETGAVDDGIKRLIENNRDAGKLDDDSPDAINKKNRTSLTKMVAAITSPMSTTDPKRAQAIFDQAKKAGVVDETQIENIQGKIDQHAVQFYATMDAAKIANDIVNKDPVTFSRNPEGSQIQMFAEAERLALEKYPEDAAHPENTLRREQYLNQVRTNIQTTTNQLKKAQDDRTRDLKAIVQEGLGKDIPGTGRKPISMQEMITLNPKFQDYYDEAVRRDPTFQAQVNNKFLANSKEDKAVDPNQLAKQKAIWAGMQPNDKMLTDPSDMFNKGLIDKATRDQFDNDKNKIKSAANNIFAADAILRRHGATLNDAGIRQSATDKESNEKYMGLRGALESELQRIQTGPGGHQVKGPEEDQIINNLLKSMSSGEKGWFGGDIKKPMYEIMTANQPDWVKENYRDAVKDTKTGNWLVWREGKPFFIRPPAERK